MSDMRRREFITLLGGAAAAWPLAARAQQSAKPGGWLPLHRPAIRRRRVSCAVVCRGLNHTGFVEGQNVALCGYCVRCNRGGTAVWKASIAAALVAFGIIALVQEGTNAMVTPPAGLLPALTIPAIETAALRRPPHSVEMSG